MASTLAVLDSSYRQWQKRLAQGGFFRRFWVFWGVYGIVFYALFGVWILFVAPQGWKILLMAGCSVLFARYIVCELIEFFYRKAHPYQRLNFQVPTFRWLFSSMDDEHDAFPSQHASCSVAISTVLYLFFPILGWLGLAVAIMVGIARIIIGYHELIDVAWGFLVGLMSGYLIYLLLFPALFTGHF